MKIRKKATLDYTYDPVFKPFSFIYNKTFKILLESEMRIRKYGIRRNSKNANLQINPIFLSDSEKESECECSPKIRRIAIPNSKKTFCGADFIRPSPCKPVRHRISVVQTKYCDSRLCGLFNQI